MKRWLCGAGVGMLLCGMDQAAADDSGNAPNANTFRFGEYFVRYAATTSGVGGNGIGAVPAGTSATVNSLNTPYLAYVRRLSSHFDAELALGIPASATMVGQGPAKMGSVPYSGQGLASARWVSPTLLINYNFFEETATWRPYVGLGVNYTHFTDISTTGAGNAALGGPTTATLSDSYGWAATTGLKYRIDEQWSLFASYTMIEARSNLSADTAGVIRTTSVNFHPSALVLSAGYSF